MTGRAAKRLAALGALAACGLAAGGAAADPYRLRADTFATTTPAVGMVVLQAEERRPSLLYAEGLVWAGTGATSGDVLVITVGLRDPEGRGEARFGRMLVSTGAVRPVHLDGAALTARFPSGGPSLEVFGGLPVEPAFGPRSYDWLLGQRVSARSDRATVGLSYLHRRDAGRVAFEELGVDGLVQPARWLGASALAAMDLARGGLTDARAEVAARRDGARLSLFASRRSPSRLLPATSLFAALGDGPSDELGLSGFWRAAPRLDVSATGTAASIAGELAGDQRLRATLRLDDRGDGSLALELRRQGAPDASWTGARATARVPLTHRVTGVTELELAVPDHGGGRGSVWPWGLVSIAFRPAARWEVAGAVEASASPTERASLGALVRISTWWGGW